MQRRKFSREFKIEAVKLVRERAVSVAQAGRDLGVHENVLRKWVKEFGSDPVQALKPGPGLIHDSDRGVQYASEDYRKVVQSAGLVASMSRKGDCYDNAPMESFFHTLKTELVHHRRYATRDEATRDIFAYIEGFYNQTRRHSAIGYISPVEMELKAA